MNKKELIEKYKKLEEDVSNLDIGIACQIFLKDLEQLDEPEKVQIPQFVADWYEKNKDNLDYNIWNYIYDWDDQEESEFKNWFNHSKESFQTLVNMHQFGYEVETEKRYLVKIQGFSDGVDYFNYSAVERFWYLSGKSNLSNIRTHHTRKQLEEAGFGWVFDCPGIEIEEVE